MTSRIHRPAGVLSPRHEIQIDQRPPALVDRLVERLLGLFGRTRPHPPEAIRDAMHMNVDADVLLAAKGEDHHQVRRLAAHTRQRDQFLHRPWHLTAELLDNHPAGVFHEHRFVAIEADGIDQFLDLSDGQLRQRLRRTRFGEQPRRRRQGRGVLRARRQQR